MKKEYDFSKAKRGQFHRPNKVQKTIRFDKQVIDHFQKLAKKSGVPYQTLMNLALRKFAMHEDEIDIPHK